MSKQIITALVNEKVVPIAEATFMDSPPHEITIKAVEEIPEGIMDIMVVGLQYYEFSMFSILIEVIDEDTVAHHFMLDSWAVGDVDGEAMHPLKVENPYLYFNEMVRKQLTKK